MKKLLKFMLRGCGISIVTILIFAIAYAIGSEVDKKYCYEKLAKELNVSSDSAEITLAVNKKVESVLVPGMNHDQVLSSLKQIGTPFIASEMSILPNMDKIGIFSKISGFPS